MQDDCHWHPLTRLRFLTTMNQVNWIMYDYYNITFLFTLRLPLWSVNIDFNMPSIFIIDCFVFTLYLIVTFNFDFTFVLNLVLYQPLVYCYNVQSQLFWQRIKGLPSFIMEIIYATGVLGKLFDNNLKFKVVNSLFFFIFKNWIVSTTYLLSKW